ncbi:lysozyme [Dyadobacter sp. 676]|uniref:Lysozyme n=1 Tax=Dyadobacter sp. 676 TaxID=3088362 RepID=A0AAU8FJT4_9BACT
MQISSQALEILKNREELRLTAYQDSAGVWTIGYGCTTYENGAKVKAGDKITEAKAVQLLGYHVGKAVATVNGAVTATLNQGQFDALVSFTYNVGGPAFQGSTLRELVNKDPSDLIVIQTEFRRWVYVTVNGKKVKSAGLVNRREEEIAMYRGGKKS